MRVLATSGARRARELPDVPTFRELGYNIEGGGWYAAYAPGGTPKDVVDRLAAAIVDGDPGRPRCATSSKRSAWSPPASGPAELARIHKADYDKWGPVIKASGFKPDI